MRQRQGDFGPYIKLCSRKGEDREAFLDLLYQTPVEQWHLCSDPVRVDVGEREMILGARALRGITALKSHGCKS